MRLRNHTLFLTLTILAFGGLSACASEDSSTAAAPAKAPPAPVQVAQAEAPAPAAEEAPPPAPAAAKKPFKEPEGGSGPGVLTSFADVDESVGDVPHTVQLDVDIIDGTGHPPFTHIWDFGDATEFSTEKAPTHTYKIPGSFRASVITTDSKGEIDQDYFDISVNEADEPGAITAEQLMEMMPPGEIAPELAGMEEALKAHVKKGAKPQAD